MQLKRLSEVIDHWQEHVRTKVGSLRHTSIRTGPVRKHNADLDSLLPVETVGRVFGNVEAEVFASHLRTTVFSEEPTTEVNGGQIHSESSVSQLSQRQQHRDERQSSCVGNAQSGRGDVINGPSARSTTSSWDNWDN